MSEVETLDELRKELRDLAAEAGLPDWNVALEIMIEGQEQGRPMTIPPGLPPDLWDPDSKLRRVYAQIVALRKEMRQRS
jgi:hypothetical protein